MARELRWDLRKGVFGPNIQPAVQLLLPYPGRITIPRLPLALGDILHPLHPVPVSRQSTPLTMCHQQDMSLLVLSCREQDLQMEPEDI